MSYGLKTNKSYNADWNNEAQFIPKFLKQMQENNNKNRSYEKLKELKQWHSFHLPLRVQFLTERIGGIFRQQ